MKASEVIQQLQKLIDEHGDLDVMLVDYDYGDVDIVWVGRSAILKPVGKMTDSDYSISADKELEPYFTISS